MKLQNLFGKSILYETLDGLKIFGKVIGEYNPKIRSYEYSFRNLKGEFPLVHGFFEIENEHRISETRKFIN